MTKHANILSEFSQALTARVAAAKSTVVAIQVGEGRHLTATSWGNDVLIAEHCTIRDSDHQMDPDARRLEKAVPTSPVQREYRPRP